MKVKLFFILGIALILASCGNSEEQQRKEDSLKRVVDSLERAKAQSDQEIEDVNAAISQIEDNLQQIKDKEGLIRAQTGGEEALSDDAIENINDDILLIYELMLKNKRELSALQNQLKGSTQETSGLQKTIARLQKEMQERDAEIQKLRQELEEMHLLVDDLQERIEEKDQELDSLETENTSKTEIIEEQTSELNTAYYVVGTESNLKDNKVISKEGVFKDPRLRSDFNQSYFTQIDIREVKEIPVYQKKAKILTTHPVGSYELVGDKRNTEKLIIKDQQAFWSVSKYLVIIHN